jgi:hypothetical protein
MPIIVATFLFFMYSGNPEKQIDIKAKDIKIKIEEKKELK